MTKPVGPLDIPAVDAAELTPLKRAFLALEDAQARLASMEQAAREPIAVIGLGCRVPGGGNDPAGFWRLMHEGVDAIGPIPVNRWDANAFYDPDPETPGRIATRCGGFLPTIDQFDPSFFNISPREAMGMDPQQRLVLEVSWEALEHAGQAPDRLERSLTGVYMGVASSDYTYLQLKTGDPALLDAHFASGVAHSVVAGRISYLLGLQGPSVTIDTACSSSLVAVHLACTALRNGECRMALAGGVNLILAPDVFIALSRTRMLAPDGRCKTFDAAADGFSRAEGCGVIVLKRFSDAQADGNRILGLIRGSAVNQDGPSSGLTAPNGPAQEAVIREALSRAGVAPREVGYVEAHGTGTQLGDPLEVNALGAVFAADRDPARPLLIGSVKTNIGHLESAAGVASLIKVIMALQHRTIPPHLHFHTPSPHIAWAELPLQVSTKEVAWKPIEGRRIGGVSSFGFSGTNAHVVLEEAPPCVAVEAVPVRRSCLLALSARDDKAFAELASRFADALEVRIDDELADVCHTANAGRAHFAHRGTVIGRTIDELRTGLMALARGEGATGVRTARITRRDPPRIAFLFTGQGAQYAGMSQGLYEASPVFRAALDRCAELLAPHLERPLLEVLFPAREQPTVLDETAYTQPALFAVEYALSELWRSWGVTPNVVMGHSVGEYVAACVAGVLTLEDALRLIAKRGRLMQSLPPGGAMAAIFAPEERVGQAVAPYTSHLSIAAINGPAQTVISGRAAEVEAVCQHFRAQGIRCQPLPVSHAFHSPLVDSILDQFEREANAVRFAPPRMRLISNLTGRLAEASEVTRASYWRRHVREAVRFGDGLRTLGTLRPDIVIEIGPNPTLLTFASSAFDDGVPSFVASLRKGRPDWEQMLEGLAAIYGTGVQVDWRGVGDGASRRIVDLPTYPFQRERFWFEAKRDEGPAAARLRPTGHPLLGARLRSAGAETIYESRASADAPDFIRQHRVLGKVILPATAYLDMLTASARQFDRGVVCIEDVTISEAMFFDEDGASSVIQTVCGPVMDGVVAASVNSTTESDGESDHWVRHVTAKIRVNDLPTPELAILADSRAQCTDSVAPTEFYAAFERHGIDFGSGFRVIRQLWRGESQACGEIALSPEFANETPEYRIHPVLLDGCLQVMASAFPRDDAEDALYMPIGIGRFVLYRQPGAQCWSHATVRSGTGDSREATINIFDIDGTLVAELRDVQLKRVARNALGKLARRWLDQCLWEVCWEAAPAAGQPSPHAWTVATLCQAATEASEHLREAAGIEVYDVFLKRLEALCADFAVETMLRLGWAAVPGECVADDEIAARLGVVERHRRLFGRLLEILGEAGWLARENQVWRVERPFVEQWPARTLDRLVVDCPRGAKPELELTGRVAKYLDKALRGECDVLELLFPQGSLATMEAIYRDSPGAIYFNGLMAEVVAAVTRARAAGRPVRILELGGGTGGTTVHLALRLSADDVTYTFTDVGPTFVAAARDRFKKHAFMSFEVLDLEREPEAQGFANRQFDVVIASNVIHATTNLRRTLARIRRMLAPGGLLAMLEVTAPQRWFDLTVGLTPGWWAFEDRDLRPDYPIMPRDRWIQVLSEAGFDGVAALPEAPQQGCLAMQSLLLARAAFETPRHASRDWLLFADRFGIASALADRMRMRGDRCTLVRPGPLMIEADVSSIDYGSAQHYRTLLAGLRSAGRSITGVVHAWSLDCAQWDGLSATDLAAADGCGAVSAMLLAQALVDESPAPRLWLLTRGAQQAHTSDDLLSPAQAPIWGLGKTLAIEHPDLRCVCVDLAPRSAPAEVEALEAELAEPGLEQQVALRESGRRVARLARARRSAVREGHNEEPWQLVPAVPGTLDGFRRQPVSRQSPGPGEVEIAVEATGLNFKDVLNVLGLYPGEAGPLGGECAGRVTAVGSGVTCLQIGDPVLAIAAGSFASHVTAKSELIQRRPPGISAEEGSSFPIAYLTAEYCLSYLAGMHSGDRVLIHAAAGGVGMAAVRLALRAGAEVFATAGSPRKRELLRSIGVKHVFDSRSTSFVDELLGLTDGRGVDLVLNSLSGEQIDASFRVLAHGGRFVEIGKRGIKDPEWVAALNRDLRYFIADWGEIAAKRPALIGEMLARLVDELGRGSLAPLPRHVFCLDETERAFRLMAQARHVGKIVVRHGRGTKASLRRDGTYLITGGLSGLGLLVAQSFAAQGAGRLVLIGRRGASSDVVEVLNAIRGGGTTVLAEALDVSDEAALNGLLNRIRREGPPLRGVVHSAGILDDAGLLQQNPNRFARVFAPKVRGGWLLDRLTRVDPLDWFVMFSSIAAVLGSAGQANHAAANAFLDLIVRERRLQGLPGLSINWGAWTEVGAAADRGLTDRLAARGLGALTPSEGLSALEHLLDEDYAQVAVLRIDWRRYSESSGQGAQSFLADVTEATVAERPHTPAARSPDVVFREQLASAPAARRPSIVAEFVRERALRALGLDPTRAIDPRIPLGELGLDSLLSVELRNTLSSAIGMPLPATLLFDCPTIDAVTDYLLKSVPSIGDQPEVTESVGDAPRVSLLGSIEELSEEEVDRLLAGRDQEIS